MSTRKSKPKGFQPLPTKLEQDLLEKITELPQSVSTDYLKVELLSKYVSADTDPPEVRRTRAINKWLATEAENDATNDRLIITAPDYQILPRVPFDAFVSWCRNFICDTLGEVPPEEALIGSFSGGASTSRPRTKSYPSSKYLGKAHVTPACMEWVPIIRDLVPGWLGASSDPLPIELVEVAGNVLFTVPKKTDIDRVCCKEPDLNMFIQKGIGSFFRKALLRIGLNLNDQSINRSLAQRGSADGSLATLDLSSASDSVSYEVVNLLLPEIWFTLLDTVRCPVTIIDGEEHRNHMFSSMGNGFTFELESLIFLTLTKAVAYFTGTRGSISVYGDDIICPTGMYHSLVSVLQYMGFSVNPDKSFASGPFRESCGGHYSNGIDITPFYIKEPISTLPMLMDVANKLRDWGCRNGWSFTITRGGYHGLSEYRVMDEQVEPIWDWLASFVPKCLWGGRDTSFKYQLVSDDNPHSRICEDIESVDAGLGGYFHWLNATWTRDTLREGIQTSSFSRTTGNSRLKRVPRFAVPPLLSLTPKELG